MRLDRRIASTADALLDHDQGRPLAFGEQHIGRLEYQIVVHNRVWHRCVHTGVSYR